MRALAFSGGALLIVASLLAGYGLFFIQVGVWGGEGVGYVYNLSRAHQQSMVLAGAAISGLAGIVLLGFYAVAPAPPEKPQKIGYASGLSRREKASLCAMVQAKKRKEADDDFLDTLR